MKISVRCEHCGFTNVIETSFLWHRDNKGFWWCICDKCNEVMKFKIY